MKARPLRFVAYTPIESSSDPSLSQISRDLDSVKEMGFDGLKLWNTNQLYERGWLAYVLKTAGSYGLIVNVVYQFNNTTDTFPPTRAAIDRMKVAIGEIASVTRPSNAVAWNNLFAPFDWSMAAEQRQAVVTSSEYRDALEELLAAIASSDHAHQVRVSFDGDPRIGFPFLKGAQGYGIMPYTLTPDSIDTSRIQAYAEYFSPTGKPVYIDEWGLQTTNLLPHGRASSDQEKGRLVVEFARFAESLGLDWTYFMLTDRNPRIVFESGVDWGLRDLNRVPRGSAIVLENFLQSQ